MAFIKTCYGRIINSSLIYEFFISKIEYSGEFFGYRIYCNMLGEEVDIAYIDDMDNDFNAKLGSFHSIDFCNDDLDVLIYPFFDKYKLSRKLSDMEYLDLLSDFIEEFKPKLEYIEWAWD